MRPLRRRSRMTAPPKRSCKWSWKKHCRNFPPTIGIWLSCAWKDSRSRRLPSRRPAPSGPSNGCSSKPAPSSANSSRTRPDMRMDQIDLQQADLNELLDAYERARAVEGDVDLRDCLPQQGHALYLQARREL